MVVTLARALSLSSLRLSLLLSPRRLLSSSAAPSLILSRRPSLPPPSHAARFTAVRCRANRAGNSAYSPLNSSGSSNFSERPPADMAPLFPGCDYEHWLIVMDKPGGEGATKQQMIDCYIQTLAKVVGSEEEAKKKIYKVSCERYFGFGCEIDEETSNKLEGLPGVLFALPDSSYVVPEYKDYGAKFFENGEIVQRWPERKGWEEQKPQISRKNRYRSKDRIRIVTRLVGVKHKCGKSYNQLAEETGLTNVYVAQLLRRQAQLKPDTAPKLRAALPGLPEELVREMMRTPWRTYDPNLSEDPTVYRLNEAVMHFGESIKEIINEEFGDGIMSAIDFYCSVDKVKGVDGKDRVVVTFDWKYFPYSKQKSEHMVSRTSPLGNQ